MRQSAPKRNSGPINYETLEEIKKRRKKDAVNHYLCMMGLRPKCKGFEYLAFVLEQFLNNTSFPNTIWIVTGIMYSTTKVNAMRCAHNEIAHAFEENPSLFLEQGFKPTPRRATPTVKGFTSMALDWICDYLEKTPTIV